MRIPSHALLQAYVTFGGEDLFFPYLVWLCIIFSCTWMKGVIVPVCVWGAGESVLRTMSFGVFQSQTTAPSLCDAGQFN